MNTIFKILKLTLEYERSRAATRWQALLRFFRQLPIEFLRFRQMGYCHYLEHLRVEVICAEMGLSYPQENLGDGPPWQIPPRFRGLPVVDLPAHPLIDTSLLARLVAKKDTKGDAIYALRQLLAGGLSSEIWNGLQRISTPADGNQRHARIAVCLHLFYPDMWPDLNSSLSEIPEPFDLYITIPEYICTTQLTRIAVDQPGVRFFPTTNRGRDVLPFIKLLRLGYFDGYEAVCKIHSKRSPHMKDGEYWREQLISELLGSQTRIRALLHAIRKDPMIGLVGPSRFLVEPGTKLYGLKNQFWQSKLASRANLPATALQRPFFSGTMFWFRPQALDKLRQFAIEENEFPLEMSQTDGTPAHAIERLFWALIEAAGFHVSETEKIYC